MERIMVQLEGKRTIPLPLTPVTEKKRRGRPRKEGALSNAQRQAAFRARHKGQEKTVTVTKTVSSIADGYDDLVLENERLREELATTQAALRLGVREVESLRRESADGTLVGRGSLVVTDALRNPIPVGRGAVGDCRLGVTVALSARYAMERLAADIGISKGAAVERLLYWADEVVTRSFLSDDAFNRYIEKRRNGNSTAS
jgi:hypothetical protein